MTPGTPDFRKMTPEDVAKYLEQRRAELSATVQAAKAVGVKVEEAKKRPTDDKDKLEWLFERLGYQTGMRWWAQGRMEDLEGRIEAVLAVSELSPERVGALLKEASEGYRKARIGTSFDSTSMPDKKEAHLVPTSAVFQELLGKWQATWGPAPEFLTRLVEGVEVPEAPPVEPTDREMFPKDKEQAQDDGERADPGTESGGEPAGGGPGEARVATGADPLHDGVGELGPDGADAGDHVADQPTGGGRGGRKAK